MLLNVKNDRPVKRRKPKVENPESDDGKAVNGYESIDKSSSHWNSSEENQRAIYGDIGDESAYSDDKEYKTDKEYKFCFSTKDRIKRDIQA